MDELQENALILNRSIESINRRVEEADVQLSKLNASYPQLGLVRTSYGPANDILRFLHIAQQQTQLDDLKTRRDAEESLYRFMNLSEELNDDSETSFADNHEEDNSSVSTPVLHSMPAAERPPASTPVLHSMPAVQRPPAPTPVLHSMPAAERPPASTPVLHSMPAAERPPASTPVPVPEVTLAPAPTSFLQSVFSKIDIAPDAAAEYGQLLTKAHVYEERYKTVDIDRGKLFNYFIKSTMNKLHKTTWGTLTDELLNFLDGQEKQIKDGRIRVQNSDERLLCLSKVVTAILNQLLGSDLNRAKEEVLVPLIFKLSGHPKQPEFDVIFRYRLHTLCPFTVPCFPKQSPEMSDEQYLKELGYKELSDSNQKRLETEHEFLNRMNGFIRLFCKLMISQRPPLGRDLSFAWTWVAGVLNLKPRPNITVILLRTFLEEAGKQMRACYGKRFIMILSTIRDKYIPHFRKDSIPAEVEKLNLILGRLLNGE